MILKNYYRRIMIMRNKDKAFDILNEVCKEALPSSQSEDEETSRIEQLEASIMEKLERG